MNSYRIISSAGVDLGVWDGATPEEAIEALDRSAGYTCSAHAAEVLGTTVEAMRADLTVTLAESSTTTWRAGVYALDGRTRVEWSRHRTREAAVKAARRYARRERLEHVTAHGAGAQDVWVAGPDDSVERFEPFSFERF